MSFARFVQITVGFVASTGVSLVLSGSAWAADASSGTTTQTDAVPSASHETVTQTVQTVTSSSSSKDTGGTIEVQVNDNHGGGGGTTGGTGTVETPPSAMPGDQSAAQTGSPTVLVKDQPKPDAVVVPAPDDAQPRTEPVMTATGGEGGPKADVGAVVGPEVSASMHTVETVVLPIQPTITSRTALLVPDLAAALPSATAPAKAPEPAKSSGDLVRLTDELAGVTVPQAFTLPLTMVMRSVLALSLLFLVVVLGRVTVFNYGLWLRRSGFSTAARSDAGAYNSSLATSLRLGYGLALRRNHSPLLVVAETKKIYGLRLATL